MPSNEAPQTLFEKLDGLRKIGAGVIVLIVGVAIAMIKDDIPANLLQLLEVLFGGFIVGNVGEHIVGAVHARAGASVEVAKIAAEASEPEPWADEFAAVHKRLDDLVGGVKAVLGTPAPEIDTAPILQSIADHNQAMQLAQAPIAEAISKLDARLTEATTPKEDAPDYAAAIGTIVQTLDTIRKSQEITNKAISLLISKG